MPDNVITQWGAIPPPVNDEVSAGARTVQKTTGTLAAGDVQLFTISGGRVRIVDFFGEVTTVLGAGTDITLEHDDGTTETPICAITEADSDAVGTVLSVVGDFSVAMTEAKNAQERTVPFALGPGNIQALIGGGTEAGVIRWTLRYQRIDSNAEVVAA